MSDYERWSLIWYAVTALATALYSIIVVVAALVAVRQVRESARTRQAELSWSMYLAYTDPNLRAARGEVEKLAHGDRPPTTAEEYRAVAADEHPWDHYSDGTPDMYMRRLLRFYNQVAVLLRKDLIDDDFVYSLIGSGLSSCWPVLASAVDYYQIYYGGISGLEPQAHPRPIYNDVHWMYTRFNRWQARQVRAIGLSTYRKGVGESEWGESS